jgi:hypothetical protein
MTKPICVLYAPIKITEVENKKKHEEYKNILTGYHVIMVTTDSNHYDLKVYR